MIIDTMVPNAEHLEWDGNELELKIFLVGWGGGVLYSVGRREVATMNRVLPIIII